MLEGVSLRIAAGETLAVVGETGAGKSTLARLITRLHDPTRGAVRIDGSDLRDVTVTSLRSQVGVVPQEPFLFAAPCATTCPSPGPTRATTSWRRLCERWA